MKQIFIFFVFIVTSCSGQTEKNQKFINSLSNKKIAIRGNLVKVKETEFRLDYYDSSEKDSHYQFLESKGYQGGGPSWVGIIYGAIKMSDSKLLDDIRFDDEADGVAIWSSDKVKLEKIGRLISVVKTDKKILMQAISIAEQDGQME